MSAAQQPRGSRCRGKSIQRSTNKLSAGILNQTEFDVILGGRMQVGGTFPGMSHFAVMSSAIFAGQLYSFLSICVTGYRGLEFLAWSLLMSLEPRSLHVLEIRAVQCVSVRREARLDWCIGSEDSPNQSRSVSAVVRLRSVRQERCTRAPSKGRNCWSRCWL